MNKLAKSITIEVANGDPIRLDSIIYNCMLDLSGHTFSIDLVPMLLGSFDIIVGMDWLSKNHAKIVCRDKLIRIPLPSSEVVKNFGERPET